MGGEIDRESAGFDWQSVVARDFDVELDAPGDRSSAALKALEDDLGVPDEAEGFDLCGEWAQRLSNVLGMGLFALLERLSHPDLTVR
ncbi:hypothetical protein [Streptomyces abikoensis]|uniref:hypothetical protein n=1 Tax=Streptomyces abikoensis TaxID=97398 RepID=UPI00167B1EDE|nr:hypothetical protein [Streptomyces abikoensis]GGP40216.1 hypothetical protein GCM10010214_12000 [Streptomyces abikoensis]